MPSRFASSPQYSRANVVNIQLPPLMLVTATTLPFKSAGFLIFGDTMMLPMSLLIMPGDKYQVSSLRGGAQHSASDGAFMKLRFACGESSHANRSVPDMDKGQVQAIAPKEPLVLGNEHGGLPLTERSCCHRDFGQALRCPHRLHRDHEQQDKRNEKA